MLRRRISSLRPMKIRAFVADWDDTITNDTIHLVAEAAYKTHPDFPYPWDHFKKVYMDNWTRYTEQGHKRATLEDEWAYQAGMKSVELSSVNEFVRLGLFKGVKRETVEEEAEKVVIKPGAMETLKLLVSMNVPVCILSVNWTTIIIKALLKKHGIYVDGDRVRIYTNEFEEKDGVLTGGLEPENKDIRTAVDKALKLREYISLLPEEEGDVWYIGDSSTDVFAMLEADVGVVYGEHGSASKLLEKHDIKYDEGLQGTSHIKRIKSWYEFLDQLKEN